MLFSTYTYTDEPPSLWRNRDPSLCDSVTLMPMRKRWTIFGSRQRQELLVKKRVNDTTTYLDRNSLVFLVTVISALIIFYLVLSELIAYQTSTWQPELVVDKSRKDKMTIQFNVTFPKMPCHSKYFSPPLVSMDTQGMFTYASSQCSAWISWTIVESTLVDIHTTCTKYDWIQWVN